MIFPLSIPSARYTDKADVVRQKLTHRKKRPVSRQERNRPFHVARPDSDTALTRVEFDDHRLVDVASDIGAVRHLLEDTRQLVGVDFNPLGQTLTGGQFKGFLDASLALGLLAHGNHVAGLDQHGSDVGSTAVHFDGAVVHQLASFSARGAEAHAVDDVVQTRFEQLDQGLTGVAAAAVGFLEVLAELLLEHTVHALELLLFTQLQDEVGSVRTGSAAVLIGLGFKFALGLQRTPGDRPKEIGTLATREFALRSNIARQDFSPQMRPRLG